VVDIPSFKHDDWMMVFLTRRILNTLPKSQVPYPVAQTRSPGKSSRKVEKRHLAQIGIPIHQAMFLPHSPLPFLYILEGPIKLSDHQRAVPLWGCELPMDGSTPMCIFIRQPMVPISIVPLHSPKLAGKFMKLLPVLLQSNLPSGIVIFLAQSSRFRRQRHHPPPVLCSVVAPSCPKRRKYVG